MKKLLLFVVLFVTQTINSCNLCRGYVYTGQVLRRTTREIVNCECNCDKYSKVKFEDGYGYGCVLCGHRMIPEDIFEKKPKKYSKNPTWNPRSKKMIRYYDEDPHDKRVLLGQIA